MNRAERKKQLIAQGALYRAEVLLARQAFHTSLQPETLAQSAFQRVARIALAVAGNRVVPGATLQTLLPMVMSGLSLLAKKKGLLKTLLRGGAVAGIAAAAVAMLSRKSRVAHTATDTGHAEDGSPAA